MSSKASEQELLKTLTESHNTYVYDKSLSFNKEMKVICAKNNIICNIKGTDIPNYNYKCGGKLISVDYNGVFVYYNGKWAERIISGSSRSVPVSSDISTRPINELVESIQRIGRTKRGKSSIVINDISNLEKCVTITITSSSGTNILFDPIQNKLNQNDKTKETIYIESSIEIVEKKICQEGYPESEGCKIRTVEICKESISIKTGK